MVQRILSFLCMAALDLYLENTWLSFYFGRFLHNFRTETMISRITCEYTTRVMRGNALFIIVNSVVSDELYARIAVSRNMDSSTVGQEGVTIPSTSLSNPSSKAWPRFRFDDSGR
jgi:hypothetical protein